MKNKLSRVLNVAILGGIILFSMGFTSQLWLFENSFQTNSGEISIFTEEFTQESLVPEWMIPRLAYQESYQESLYAHINPEGYIWGEYQFGGPNIQLSGEILEIIKNNFPEIFNAFRWGDWWLHMPNHPGDQNSRVTLQFETADQDQARNWANWMMDFYNAFATTDYFEDGVWSRDEYWDNSWHTITDVSFSTSVQWPMLMEDFDGLIPRTYGGIAETINITSADVLRMWMWNGGDRIYQSFGAGWDSEVDHLEGNYHYEIRDLIDFEVLQRSPYQSSGDPLSTHWDLPALENLTYSVGSTYEDHTDDDYFEPWNMHNHYSVDLNIFAGDTYSDSWVDFDTKFYPYDTLPIERARVNINPYGYDLTSIEVQHQDANLINWQPYIDALPKLFEMDVWVDKSDPWKQGIPTSVSMRLQFLEPGNYQAGVDTLIADMNSLYGWVMHESQNWTENNWWWRYDYDFEAEVWEIDFNTTYTPANWTDLLTDSWIYGASGMLQEIDLGLADTYMQQIAFDPRMGGYWFNRVEVHCNSLDVMIPSPTKLYSEFDGLSHSFTMTDHLELTELVVSPEFYRTEAMVRVPVSNAEYGVDLIFPEFNNGYGFHSNYWWSWDHLNVEYVEVSFEIYTNDAYYEKDATIHYVSDFTFEFDYEFHPDTEDIIPPYGNFGWFNETGNEPVFEGQDGFWEKSIYNGTERITLNAWDDSWLEWWANDVYTGTDVNGVPQFSRRFPTSDIISVECDLWWNELAIDHEDFHWTYSMEYNFSRNFYYHDLDTTQLADGWYSLGAKITDEYNNVGGSGWEIEVDNYDESFTEFAQIEFLDPTPTNGSAVSDTVTFRVNLTDDEGVFGAVYTKDGNGYVLDEDNYISEGIYEITWDTWAEPENSWHLFSITVWDMEGHKTILYYSLQVDNLHVGDPPVVYIISPDQEGLILEDFVTFSANVTDDWGISSVQGRFDDRGEIDMELNESSGLWQLTYNVSTLVNGSHTFTTRAVDIDENQHIRDASLDFLVNNSNFGDGGIPPEFRNVIPGNFTSADDIFEGNIDFSIEVSDEIGIESVNIQIFEVNGLNPTDVSLPGDVDLSDIRILTGYPHNMVEGSTSDDWTTFTDTWDTSQSSSGVYLVEILVSDADAIQTTISVKMLVILSNPSMDDDLFGNIPGFPAEIMFGFVGLAVIGLYLRLKRRT
ncbi:MAG: Ig-like domain-containing protein [Promethearchaeota archaeon]